MELGAAQREFIKSVELMVGHELSAVRYFGISTGDGSSIACLETANCHSVDYGLDMEMRSGAVFGIIWSGRFWQYGIDVIPASLTTEVNTSNIEDLSRHQSWAHLLGQKIADVKVHWSWSGYINEPKVWFPQEVELVFTSGFSVYFCASELREGVLTFQQDSIAVVFGALSARRHGVGPYRGG